MKILKLVNDLGYGGTQRCAQNYALGLNHRGHDVSVLAYAELGSRAAILKKEGIPVSLLTNAQEINSRTFETPDIIHIHREGLYNKYTTELLVTLRNRFPRTAIVETNVFSRVDWFLPEGVVDVHFQLSDWCLMKYLKWARGMAYNPAAMVVPYLVDDKKFVRPSEAAIDAFLQKNNIPNGAIVFGRIGQPIESKWSTCIIDGFCQAQIENSFLILVSAPTSHIEKVKTLPQKIRDRIRLVDFIKSDSELKSAYSSFNFFVHAALIGESFGMVLAESILCETPIITLSTPLKDNTQSFLIPECSSGYVVKSTSDLVAAMKDAVNCSRRWKIKILKARECLVNRYGIESVMSRLELGYQRALELRNGKHCDWTNEYSIAEKRVKAELKKYGFSTRMKFAAIHNPWIYKLYQSYRRRI